MNTLTTTAPTPTPTKNRYPGSCLILTGSPSASGNSPNLARIESESIPTGLPRRVISLPVGDDGVVM